MNRNLLLRPLAILVWLAAPALYGAAVWAAAAMDGSSPGEVVCFDLWTPEPMGLLRMAVAALGAIGAVLVLFVMPWLLGIGAWRRLAGKGRVPGAWSLAINSVALVLVCLMLRTTIGIHRGGFVAAWMIWTAVLLALAGGPVAAMAEVRRLGSRCGPGILIGLAAVLASMAIFGHQQFGQCFEGDGTETYELARSLGQNFLPYWEIDAVQRFGNPIAHPGMSDSYWTFAMQVLLGQGEFSTRLVYWVWWLGVFAVALEMSQPGTGRLAESALPQLGGTAGLPSSDHFALLGKPGTMGTWSVAPAVEPRLDWRGAIPLALTVFLGSIWYTFYTGYDPTMTDLAGPGTPDAMLILLVLLALNCLRQGDLAGWAVTLGVCSLTSYAGPVMFGLITASALVWQPVPWRRMLRGALGAGLLLAGIVAAYIAWGWSNGCLSAWWQTLTHESFEGYYLPIHPTASGPDYLLYFLLAAGGLPVLGLLMPFLPREEDDSTDLAWRQTVAMVVMGYMIIILGARSRNLHYLGPLMPIPLILWLQAGRRISPWARVSVATASLAVCIVLCWPPLRPQFTLNRELGEATTFQTDSYEEAVRMAPLVHSLRQRDLISWQIGPHTWVLYSELAARPTAWRPFVVTEGPSPGPQYKLLHETPRHVKLYCRDAAWAAWLRNQDPPKGRDRMARILRAAAGGGIRD